MSKYRIIVHSKTYLLCSYVRKQKRNWCINISVGDVFGVVIDVSVSIRKWLCFEFKDLRTHTVQNFSDILHNWDGGIYLPKVVYRTSLAPGYD